MFLLDWSWALLRTVLQHWILIIVVSITAKSVYNCYFHPLSAVPGPFWASISRGWFLWQGYAGKQHKVHIASHEKYGLIFRAAPNYVLVNDPKYIQQIYKYDRADYFLAFETSPGVVGIAGMRSMKQHNQLKKKIAAGYSLSSILQAEPHIDTRVTEWLSQLHSQDHTKTIDIGRWLQWLAMDVVMDMSFGEPIGFVRQSKDVNGIIKSVHDMFDVANLVTLVPGIVKFMQLPFIYRFVAPKPTDKAGMGMLRNVADNAVKARVEQGNVKNRRDLLQQFTEYRGQSGEALTRLELENEALTPILAGSDSTAATLRATILYISTNPHVYNKLLHEVHTAETSGSISHPIQYQEALQLPYLQAIIKESIRTYPPVGVPLPRVVPAGGVTISGHFLPEGTWIGVSPWALHRRKDVYGEDADVFVPERWLESEERSREWDKLDVTFGSGYCTCLGKNVATVEINKIVVELFRNFEVLIADPETPWEMANMMGFTHKNFLVRLLPREKRA